LLKLLNFPRPKTLLFEYQTCTRLSLGTAVNVGKLCSAFEIQNALQYGLSYQEFYPPKGRSHQSGREHLVLLKPTSRFSIMLPACSFRCIVCHEFLWCLMPTRGQKWSTIRQPHNQVSMLTKFGEFRCKHVSVSEVGDGFQVLFEKIQDSEVGYVLVQRHFEYPDGGKCYHRNR